VSSGRASKQWRAPAGVATDPNDTRVGVPYTAGNPLERPIMRDDVFHATVAHYAALAGVSVEHLRTSLRFTLRAGEQVLARHIRDCAEDLARSGYRLPAVVAPPLPAPDLAPLAPPAKQRRRDRSPKSPEQAPRFFPREPAA
jgi:hypothetical protein